MSQSPSPEMMSDDGNDRMGDDEMGHNNMQLPPADGNLDAKALKEQEKQAKKEQQRLEKERKEEEKRQQKAMKDEEKRMKKELELSNKEQRGGGSTRQKTRRNVTTSTGSGIRCVIHLLDDTDYEVNLEKSVSGEELFNKVCEHLNLLEKDYFSLTYYSRVDIRTEEGAKKPVEVMFWLDHTKKVINQVPQTKGSYYEFDFVVKFYPPDPTQMKEDLTRYQLCLQVRKDILTRRLPGSFVTYALLGSYTAQAELGDYDEAEHGRGYAYLQEIPFAPQGIQSEELLEKIAELHRSHRDQKPAEAELHFLDAAKKLALYGVEKHPARDFEGVDIAVGVSAMGVMVYRESDGVCMNHFAWPKVLKISYHHSKFYLRIRAGELENAMSKVSFKLAHRKLAKRLWRSAIETHAFFRLKAPEVVKASVMPHFGSKFRYSGRTYHQCRQDSSQISRGNPMFQRSMSSRSNRSFQRADGGQETPQYGQVQVLAGTGTDAHKVAYVKTVFHDDREPVQERMQPPVYQQQRLPPPIHEDEEDELPPDQHDLRFEEQQHYEPGEDWATTTTTTATTHEVTKTKKTKKSKEKKKKQKQPVAEDEYQTGQGDTMVERRLHVSADDDDDEDDKDYDRELSEAIKRVTRVDSNMEVKKIEVKTKTVR